MGWKRLFDDDNGIFFFQFTLKRNALISLRLCAGWSGPALSANCIRALFVRYASDLYSQTLDWETSIDITKTCLYNVDPLKPHFYIVKLGFTGVYIIFLISAQKHRLWVLVRTASPRRFQQVPTIYVLSRNRKNIRIFIWFLFLYFFGGNIFSIFE